MTHDDLRNTADAQAERSIFTKLRAIDDAERSSHAKKGIMGRAVRDQELWRHRIDDTTGMPCTSWSRWVRVVCPYGYSSVMKAVSDVDELSPKDDPRGVPIEDLSQIASCNFDVMRELSTAVRTNPKVLAAAKTMKRSEDFASYIERIEPTQHIEGTRFIKLAPTRAQHKEISDAVELAIENGDGSCPTEVVWGWAIAYVQEKQLEREITESIRTETHEGS